MTDELKHEDRHEHALALAAEGRREEALAALREHLLGCPLDGEALNDAGALLYGLGRHDEAARHLELALRQLKAGRGQALENLAEVYLAAGQGAKAAGLFGDLAALGTLKLELAHRAAAALLGAKDFAGAVEALLRAGELSGQAQAVAPALEKVRRLRPRVGLLRHGERGAFGRRLEAFLAQRYPTRAFRGRTRAELDAFLQGCDVAWFEGCTAEAVIASRRPACRLVVNVQPPEAYGPALEQVHWANVDLLTTCGAAPTREFLARRLPELSRAGRIVALPRGVDVPQAPPNRGGPGKGLACIGGLCLRANPMLLLQCFARLRDLDGEYRLHFAGYFQDDMLEVYITGLVRQLGLEGAVHFDGWQEDLGAWLADKSCVVSAAIGEDADGAVLNAMASGLRPVVHAFPGAEELYGAEGLYRTPEEFCRRILEGGHDPTAHWRFICERHPMDRALRRADELLTALERQAAGTEGAAAAGGPRGEFRPVRPQAGAETRARP